MKKSVPPKKPKRCPSGHTHLSWSPDKDEVYCWDCNKKYSLTECLSPRGEEPPGDVEARGSEMKVFLILFLLVFSIGARDVSQADSKKSKDPARKGYLQKDFLFKDRTNIHKKDGRRKGYLEQDWVYKQRTNVYDKDGSQKGYLQQDWLSKDTKIIYDRKGRKKGYLKQDYLFKYRNIIYDKNGREKGYLQKDPLLDNRTNIYKR